MSIEKMKAIVATKYGPPEVLVFKEFDKPVPKDNEVLIKIFATSGHIGDSRMRRFDIPGGFIIQILARIMLGFNGPSRIAKNSVLGMDIAGEIEEVGKNVTRFKKGDQVFASTFYTGFGGYAEYKCMAEDAKGLTFKPTNMTYKEAGVIPAGQEVISIGGTGPHHYERGGGIDTAYVIEATRSSDFFKLEDTPEFPKDERRKIKEIICKPR